LFSFLVSPGSHPRTNGDRAFRPSHMRLARSISSLGLSRLLYLFYDLRSHHVTGLS